MCYCKYRKYDREGSYCGKTNLVCYGNCSQRTDSSPAYNSSTGELEMFIDGKLEVVDSLGNIKNKE